MSEKEQTDRETLILDRKEESFIENETETDFVKSENDMLRLQIEKRKTDDAMIIGRNSNKIANQTTNCGNNSLFSFNSNGTDILEPPFDFGIWAYAPTFNSRLNRVIRVVARNTVGLGYEVVPKKEIKEDTPEEVKTKILEEKERLQEFLEYANPDMPFTSMMFCIKQDQETLGNGYMEIVRNNVGEIISLYHVPAITIRILKNERGYVQITTIDSHIEGVQPARIKVYFKKLGLTDDVVTKKYPGAINATMDKTTGLFVGEFRNGQDDSDGRQETPLFGNRATELLHFKIPTPIDSFYGAPKHIACSLAISGNRLASRRNANFFNNDAVPRMAVLVSGGNLTQKSKESVTQFFRQGQGPDESNRVLVLEVDKSKMGMIDPDKTRPSLELKPLTVGINEDANFLKYIRENNEEIRESHGIPQIFFRSDDINKASSSVSKKIVDEQEFEPERKEIEFILNHKLFKEEPFGIDTVKLRFKKPDTVDLVEQAQYFSLLSKVGALTPDDIREEIGKNPYPEDFVFAKKPLVISVPELQMGLAPTTLNNPESPELNQANTQQTSNPKSPNDPAAPKAPKAPKKPNKPGNNDESDDREDTSQATQEKSLGDIDRESNNISQEYLLKTGDIDIKAIKQELLNLREDMKSKLDRVDSIISVIS